MERIQRFIAERRSMRFETVNGLSFLMYSIAMMEEELAVSILRDGVGIDVNECWDSGQTPLHCAVQMECVEAVAAIFKFGGEGVNLYAVTNDFLVHFTRWESGGRTVLHYAAVQNHIGLCQRILEFEGCSTSMSRPRLLTMRDLQGNDAIDTALMHHHLECARYLYAERRRFLLKYGGDDVVDGLLTDDAMGCYLKNRMEHFRAIKKMVADSKATKLRFETAGNQSEAVIAENDIFVVEALWTRSECERVLKELVDFGDATNWRSNRYQSFATTDIPLSMMGDEFGAFIRKELHWKLYPQIARHYGLEQRFEIGPKYLFFVRYNDDSEYRSTTDNFKQNSLNLHRDGSLLSFNVLLNRETAFEGGGTYFKDMDRVVQIKQGDSCVHPGNTLHCGHGIVKGTRYVLVGFLNAKKLTKDAAKTLSCH